MFSCPLKLSYSGVRVKCFNFMPSSFLLLRPVLARHTNKKCAKWRAVIKREVAQTATERFIILDAERHMPCSRDAVAILGNGRPSPVPPNDKESSNAPCLPRRHSVPMLFVVVDVNVK